MPSKRTNDSVDRILADLNQRQAADGVRASVTDHQVDEILRSVGISTTPLQNTPTQDSQIAFSDFSFKISHYFELRLFFQRHGIFAFV